MVNGFGQSNGSAAGTGIPPESSWTEASITARLWKFYREKTSTRAITQLQFVEHIGYLLFLKLDHERANRSSKFARKPVAPVDAWPNLVLLSGEALHTGLSSLMKKLGDQALVDHPGQQTASMVFRDAQPWPLDRMAELAKLITDEIDPYQWRTAPKPNWVRPSPRCCVTAPRTSTARSIRVRR